MPDDMGLELDTAMGTAELGVAMAWVQKFMAALGKTRPKLLENADPHRWAADFAALMADHTAVEIANVLDWHLSHLKDPHAPKAFAASAFRKKYNQIKAAMLKDPASVEVSEEAKIILRRLHELVWPRSSEFSLPMCVQRSLDAYKPFNCKCLEYLTTTRVEHNQECVKIDRFLMYLYSIGFLCKPQPFVINWMIKVHDSVAGWADWSGDMSMYVFTPDHQRFTTMGCDAAVRYCNDPKRFIELVKEVMK